MVHDLSTQKGRNNYVEAISKPKPTLYDKMRADPSLADFTDDQLRVAVAVWNRLKVKLKE